MTRPANIFNVAPGRPFLEALAQAILGGDLPSAGGQAPDPLDLPAMTILLPTRRAARALQEAFLKAGSGRAMLLPAIRPIAEADEDAGLFEAVRLAPEQVTAGAELPPAVGKLERQLVLTRLVMAWSAAMRRAPGAEGDADELAPFAAAGAGTPAQAARLASDLARLMDTIETENVALNKLASLVPEALSEHWQQTLEFLRIITEFWPVHLKERGYLSPMDRRNRAILAEAGRLALAPPAAPIIIAGVTGSIPATAELMRAVLRLPNGAIVLPGLDRDLDEATWQGLAGPEPHVEHPQYGFRMLLERLDVGRDAVAELPGQPLAAARRHRNRLVSEALRPTGSMGAWRDVIATADRDQLRAALDGVCLIEAATAEEEAEAIALILREAAETPGRTAALVSPDRLLARRVAVRLEAWGIRVDDSAGRPLAKTLPGAFLDLVVAAFSARYAPAPLMALLKHPLTRLGLGAGDVRRRARNLELAAFRTPYLGSGLGALDRAIERAAHAAGDRERRHGGAGKRLGTRDWADVRDLVRRLSAAFAPLEALRDARAPASLMALAAAHAEVAEAIAQPADPGIGAAAKAGHRAASAPVPSRAGEPAVTSPLWHGEAGEAAWRVLESLTDPAAPAPELSPADYPDFYRALISGESVRSRVPVHPRLFIWGPFEARLQQPDVLVLGALNEGTWPKSVDPGAWLNRPMRRELGLPAPEEETGRAAHDVASFLGADRVILTRAGKVEGVPRVASRWLLRLEALLSGLELGDALAPRTPWLAWARSRKGAPKPAPVKAPEPRPPLAMRPRRASVSDVETWLANPYAIFARRVLKLEPLPALGVAPGPQEKGQIIHEALSRFAAAHKDTLPPDIAAAFLAAAGDVIESYRDDPRVRAFWQPRLARFAGWFAATEAARRDGIRQRLAEVGGLHVLEAPGGPFTLSARADRIDVGAAGAIITDYKTGTPPNSTAVREGHAQQLPLEAAMAIAGAFTGLAAMDVAALRYIAATGGEPPGRQVDIDLKGRPVAEVAAAAMQGLAELVAAFDDPATPYRAVRRPGFSYRYDDYAHLARVGEWSADDESEEAA